MTDVVSFDVGFDGNRAFRGLETLRGLLNTTKKSALVDTAAITRSLNSINDVRLGGKLLDGFAADLERTRVQTEASLRAIRASVEAIPAPATRAQSALAGFAGGIAAIGFTYIISGLRETTGAMMDFADKASTIQAKLTLATSKFGDFAQANKDVVAIANKTRADIGSVTDLYSTMARNATTLKLSQQQVAQATTSVGMALKISGAGAQQASAAILQLSQAMGTGKLSGDEFASLAENAPRLMDLFAEALGRPRGELKKLASDGKITGAVIAKALTDPKLVANLEHEFGKIPVTFADIRTAFGNTFTLIAGAFAKGFGISDSLAVILTKVQNWGTGMQPTFEAIGKAIRQVFEQLAPVLSSMKEIGSQAISFLVNNMGALIGVAKAAAAAFLVFKAAAGAQWIAGTVSQIIALERALGAGGVASAIFSAGMKAVQSAINGVTIAIAANPIGFLAVALTAAITLLYQFRDSIMIGGGSIASLGDMARAAFEYIGPAISAIGDLAKSVFDSIGQFFSDNFQWIADVASSVFGDLDVSILGFMRLVARVLDTVTGLWRGTFNMIVAYWSNLPRALAAIFVNAFNQAATIVEGFINKTIGGINRVLAFANSLGASFGQIGNVSIGKMSGGGAVQLGRQMGEAYTAGFTRPLETGLNAWVKRADQIAADRKRRSNQQSRQDAQAQARANVPTPAAAGADGKGGNGKADAAKKAAEATKKYEDAVRSLNDRIRDLTLTQEQKALADEMERAGLGRDVEQVNAKADAIRALFRTLKDGEQAKKVSEVLADFNEKVRELAYNGEQLAQVEARRRAGLSTDLAVTNEMTQKIDAQAAAYYNLQKAKENASALKDFETDQDQRKQDLELDGLARTNPAKAEDERRLAQIKRERELNL
jgi:tape measure domain-containing protein